MATPNPRALGRKIYFYFLTFSAGRKILTPQPPDKRAKVGGGHRVCDANKSRDPAKEEETNHGQHLESIVLPSNKAQPHCFLFFLYLQFGHNPKLLGKNRHRSKVCHGK